MSDRHQAVQDAAAFASSNANAAVEPPGRRTEAQAEGGSEGAPLPEGQRRKYESTFGTSLGDVRVHTGKYASTLAGAHNARAFATGTNVYFGAGEDPKNDKLLAHELAHTVQQKGTQPGSGPLPVTNASDPAEREADCAAEAAMAGESASLSAQPRSIARKGTDDKEEPEEVGEFEDAWFSASKFALQRSGGLGIQVLGNKVKVQSPEVIATSMAKLSLPKNRKLGNKTIQVGPIQTLTSSKRTGIYKKEDKTQHKTKSMNKVRDASPVSHKDGTTTYSMKSEKGPFYSGNPNVEIHKQDVGLTDDKKRAEGTPQQAELGTMAGDTPAPVQVVMIDQPSMGVDKELPDGSKLIGTEGSDEFNTSAGFKTSSGQTFAKAPFGWRVSWNKTIDIEDPDKKDKNAKDPIEQFDAKEAIVEETEVFAVQIANINSVEEAAYRPLSWLVQSLSKARDVRPEAADFMEQAIAGKKVVISVTPRRSASDGSVTAKLNIDVTPSITKMGATKGVVAMVGETKEYVTTLGALANAKSINLGDSIHIAANEWSDGTFGRTDHLGGTCSVPLPLENPTRGTLSDGEGSIDVSVKIS